MCCAVLRGAALSHVIMGYGGVCLFVCWYATGYCVVVCIEAWCSDVSWPVTRCWAVIMHVVLQGTMFWYSIYWESAGRSERFCVVR